VLKIYSCAIKKWFENYFQIILFLTNNFCNEFGKIRNNSRNYISELKNISSEVFPLVKVFDFIENMYWLEELVSP